MIAIVDYDVGNLKNVYTALGDVGLSGTITRDKKILDAADAIILPGVGAFSDAMDNLKKFDLIDALNDNVKKGKILMGICLGMQLLFDKSYEDGEFSGLSYIPGEIIKFDAPGIKIPHMGWNNLVINRNSPLVKNISTEDYVYFVHSYYFDCETRADVLFTTNYGHDFASGIQRGGVMGVQFHPEKSHRFGLQLIQNFIEL